MIDGKRPGYLFNDLSDLLEDMISEDVRFKSIEVKRNDLVLMFEYIERLETGAKEW